MSAWQTWMERPQSTFLRKALFQVHLWIGVALGVYVLLMSISGTILVYRVELSRHYSKEPVLTGTSNPRLTVDELKAERGQYQIITPAEASEYVANGVPLFLQPLVGGIPPDVAWRYLETAAYVKEPSS